MASIFQRKEFFYYFVIGILATSTDWLVFAILQQITDIHYQAALALAYFAGSITHYFANKIITFQFRSKKTVSQYSLYLLVALLSLILSMGVMAILVHCVAVNPVLLRIATTFIMLIPNYLLHKHISFSKRIFKQSH